MPRTLAGARADVLGINAELTDHCKNCATCGDKWKGRRMCETGQGLAAELAAARKLVKTWFDPGPDQGTLL